MDTAGGVQQVVGAWTGGNHFGGFDRLLVGREPWEAQSITGRICGVCPAAHATAAALALDSAGRAAPAPGVLLRRNLALGASFLEAHLLHFYHLALADFTEGQGGQRFDAPAAHALLQHRRKAQTMRRMALEMIASWERGRPRPPAPLTTTQIAHFKIMLAELVSFIRDVYIEDVEALALRYPDYLALGVGYRNLLAFGGFDLDGAGKEKFFRGGRIYKASPDPRALDPNQVTGPVVDAWRPDAEGEVLAWPRAPRYAGVAYEVGPLARMWINGTYTRGFSVMDRHRARAYEAWQIAMAMQDWLAGQQAGVPESLPADTPSRAFGIGLTEAPRGALGHWVRIVEGKIARYQVLTPTNWNASPRDSAGKPGPLEQALAGTPVENLNCPIEVLRVIHSFDPCLDCSVHLMRPGKPARVFRARGM